MTHWWVEGQSLRFGPFPQKYLSSGTLLLLHGLFLHAHIAQPSLSSLYPNGHVIRQCGILQSAFELLAIATVVMAQISKMIVRRCMLNVADYCIIFTINLFSIYTRRSSPSRCVCGCLCFQYNVTWQMHHSGEDFVYADNNTKKVLRLPWTRRTSTNSHHIKYVLVVIFQVNSRKKQIFM